MTEKLTHWKALANPDYIGSYALQPNEELTLTIKEGKKEQITGENGRKEEKLVLYFYENVKPMILNRTNAKTITKLHKTPYIQEWAGKKITIYSRKVSAFGEEVDALRIRDYLPQPKQVDPNGAIHALSVCTTLEELKSIFQKLSKEEASHPEVIKAKDTQKQKLTPKQ